MIKVAICDDEKGIVGQIDSFLNMACEAKGISIDIDAYFCGDTLGKAISSGVRYDLIYLDIQMKSGDGISTAKNIRKIDENVLIIYVSGYERYAVELFRLDVFSFVRKPIDEQAFINLFIEANDKICKKMFYFTFNYKSEEYKVPCNDILYFESKGRQVVLYLRNEEIKIFNGKLSEVEIQLAKGKIPFMRIHQSYLINYYWVKSRTKTCITLVNGIKLPISENREKQFRLEYGKLLGGEINV